jgi:FixJ family two-component response regulator
METNRRATVFVVDADVTTRESLKRLVRAAGMQVETFNSAEEFLARPRFPSPGCLIADVTLPGLDGLELQNRIADRPEVPVIFLTFQRDIRLSVRAMKAGAVDYLTKPLNDDAVLNAIESAVACSQGALLQEARVRDLRTRYKTLSARERQVMWLVVRGLLNKQIAAELAISEITVKAHRGKVTQKMAADSLPDLVNMARKLRVDHHPYEASGVGSRVIPIGPIPPKM